jgi:flagellin
LLQIDAAIATVAGSRGTIGAGINRLQAATNVITNQVQNLTSAQDGIVAADISQVVGNLSRFSILDQTGIASLAQANSTQQNVLQLMR